MRGNLGVMHYKNNQLAEAVTQLGLAIRGGTLEEGTTVEGLPLNYGTVAEYYAIYGLALAKLNRCNEAVPIFQAIRSGVPDDEINVYNAEQGLIICQAARRPQQTISQAGRTRAETIETLKASHEPRSDRAKPHFRPVKSANPIALLWGV
jgi:hypothetical protein